MDESDETMNTSLRQQVSPHSPPSRDRGWLFILPSVLILALLGLPLAALMARAAGREFCP